MHFPDRIEELKACAYAFEGFCKQDECDNLDRLLALEGRSLPARELALKLHSTAAISLLKTGGPFVAPGNYESNDHKACPKGII